MIRTLILILLMMVFLMLAFHPARDVHGPRTGRTISALNLIMFVITFAVLIYHLSRGITTV